jgi:hypothetical protein
MQAFCASFLTLGKVCDNDGIGIATPRSNLPEKSEDVSNSHKPARVPSESLVDMSL